jgi:hypothetical protein
MDTKSQPFRFKGSCAEKLLNVCLATPPDKLGRRIPKNVYRELTGYASESKFAARVIDKLIEYVNTHPEIGAVKTFPAKHSVVLILQTRIIAISNRYIIVREKKGK